MYPTYSSVLHTIGAYKRNNYGLTLVFSVMCTTRTAAFQVPQIKCVTCKSNKLGKSCFLVLVISILPRFEQNVFEA